MEHGVLFLPCFRKEEIEHIYQTSLYVQANKKHQSQKNLHYTRVNTRLTSGGVHVRGLAPGQRTSKVTLQRWRAVGDTASAINESRIEVQTSRTNNDVFYHYANQQTT